MSTSPQRLQRKADADLFDGVVRKSVVVEPESEGGRITALTHQDCSAVLDHNKEVMAQGGARSLSFGKAELCIPELVLAKLKKKYPDLAAPDMQIRVKAWKKFLASSESKPWRVSTPRYV